MPNSTLSVLLKLRTMKRLVITLVLIGIVYVLVQMVISGVKTYTNSASVILSGIDTKTMYATIRSHYNSEIFHNEKVLPDDAKIIITPAYINTDEKIDFVVRVESKDTCASTGCITTLFTQTDFGTVKPVASFAFAIQSIEVLESITNQMHDIRINDKSTLKWNGTEYAY